MKEADIDKIKKEFEEQLKRNYVKALVQGGEVAYQTILSMIEDGKTLEDIQSFCKKSLSAKGKKTFEKVVDKQ